MLTIIFLFLIPNILTYIEGNSNELHCDFVTEQGIVQKCLTPFLDKVNFGQLLFEEPFADTSSMLCKLYNEYENCSNEYEENCRTLNTKSEHFFTEICSSNFQKQLNQHHVCLSSFRNHFVYSPECSMLQSDQETTLSRSEYEHNKIEDRICRIAQWYHNCSLTDAYNTACPTAAQIIRGYYGLLLNFNHSSCDLRKLNSNLPGLNFIDPGTITHLRGNSNKIVESLGDLSNPTNENSKERCDIANERYVVKAAKELRKYEYLGYQLFRTPFNQLIERTPCLAYKIYKKNVQGISSQCRNMNIQLEKIYDYYCGDSFANLLLNQESCVQKLHLIYNESECSNVTHFTDRYNSLFKMEESDLSSQRCKFSKWFLGCGITKSFYDECPQITRNMQNYFEILINANNSNCYLRQPTADHNETILARLIRQPTDDRNETVTDQPTRQPMDDRNETDHQPTDDHNKSVSGHSIRQPMDDRNETVTDQPTRQPMDDRNETDHQPTDDHNKSVSGQSIRQSMDDRNETVTDQPTRQPMDDRNKTVSGQSIRQPTDDRNETVSGQPTRQPTNDRNETDYQPTDDHNKSVSGQSIRQPTDDRNETVSGQPTRQPTDDGDSSDYSDRWLCSNCTVTDCPQGFYYDEHSAICIDVDECAANKHFCSQKCINKRGSYECECFGPLYKLARNGHQCYRTDSEAVRFFLAHSHSVWNITHNAKSQLKLAPSYGDEKVAMFDYDFKEKKLYYVDLTRNLIQYVNLFDSKKVHVIQNHDVEGTEGIVVDWIHRNLYTLRQKRLHVQRLDGLYRASLYDGFFQLPRALVAYPSTRELFASDWGVEPFIVRLAMDGTQAKKIITEDLVWPNALAIDYFAERLYWADAFRDVIEMADLDGTGRRVIINDDQLVPHVFGLTVFDDMIFWSDWTRRGFLFANKLTGQNPTMLMRTVLPPYSLKAYHPAMQMEAPNVCETAKCQHICVPKLDGSGPQCLCTEGFIMHENGFCEPNCKKDQLLCSRPDHKCLSLIYRCDGSYNCGNGDDEMECPIAICMYDERMFPCRDNRKCILRSQRCDGYMDCYDESDELYCADLAIGWSH